MIFLVLALTGGAIALLYHSMHSSKSSAKIVVDVVSALDGRTVEVYDGKRKERVILAGIGFPSGDHRSEQDSHDAVHDVAQGRRLYMEIHKEVEGLKYVSLMSANGDCLNAMMLKRGLARYESTGVGYIAALVEAENEARMAGLGIWDKHRALFRQISPEHKASDAIFERAHPYDDED